MFYSIELLGKKTALGAVWCVHAWYHHLALHSQLLSQMS